MEGCDDSEYPQPPPQFTPTAPAAPVDQHPLSHYPQLPVKLQPDIVVQQPMPMHVQHSVQHAVPLCVQHPLHQQPLTITEHHVHVHQRVGLGSKPTMVVCANCEKNVLSEVKHEPTVITHLFALGFCLVGLIPCVILPYCLKSFGQNTNHYCSECETFIGS